MATPKGLGHIPAPSDRQLPDTTATESGLDSRQLTAVGKALVVLAAFRYARPSLSLAELAKRADMPKSTVFRLLSDLESAGFVERDGRDYRLGLSLFELGSRVDFNRPNGLRELATHDLVQLYTQTGMTVHLAVLSGSHIVYVEKLNRAGSDVRVVTVPGARTPASVTALGKAILAFRTPEDIRLVAEGGLVRRTQHSCTDPRRFLAELTRVRETGIAYEREENAIGVVSIAAPVIVDREAIASVSVSGAATGFPWATIEPRVKATAAAVSRLLRTTTPGIP